MAAVWRDGEDLLLRVQARPRASRDEIVGLHGEAVRIRIAAPPVDGEANEALCRFLARECGVAAGAVTLERGASGKQKTIRIRAPRRLPPVLAGLLT